METRQPGTVQIVKATETQMDKATIEGKPVYDTCLNVVSEELLDTLNKLKDTRQDSSGDLYKHATAVTKIADALNKQIKMEQDLHDRRNRVMQRVPDDVIARRLKTGLAETQPKEVVKAVLETLGLEYPVD